MRCRSAGDMIADMSHIKATNDVSRVEYRGDLEKCLGAIKPA